MEHDNVYYYGSPRMRKKKREIKEQKAYLNI